MDSEVKAYLNYYDRRQNGGALPAEMYRGARRWGTQDQAGGSDHPVRTMIGAFAPALAHGAASFLADMASGYASGEPLGDAASKAITPAIMTAVRSIGKQRGSGKRRGKQRRTTRLASRRRPAQQGGAASRKRHRGVAYKRGRSAKLGKTAKRNPLDSLNF